MNSFLFYHHKVETNRKTKILNLKKYSKHLLVPFLKLGAEIIQSQILVRVLSTSPIASDPLHLKRGKWSISNDGGAREGKYQNNWIISSITRLLTCSIPCLF